MASAANRPQSDDDGAPPIIGRLLRSPVLALAARILLTSAFWTSGVAKLLDFGGATAEVAGLTGRAAVAAPVAALVILVQLVGSAMVIAGGRGAWLGAGALGVFTLIATVLAHAFWNAPEAEWARQLATFMEHMGLIGGLMLAAILSQHRGR